jgi:hypothetical protein
MTAFAYAIAGRNVAAKNEAGEDCQIALILIKHENGTEQTLAINEEMIRFAGEGVIEKEVQQAASLPSTASLGNPLKL